MTFFQDKPKLPIIMKPKMKLASDAFLLDDITLPKFYSVQFEFSLNKNQNNNEKNKLILGFTDNLNQTGTAGYREPSFEVATKSSELVFVTKISSGNDKKKRHEISINDEWHDNWLSFKKCIILKVSLEKADLSGGPIMPAISVMFGNSYAYNNSFMWDKACLQSQ